MRVVAEFVRRSPRSVGCFGVARDQAMRACWARCLLLVLPSLGLRNRYHGASACECDVRFYQTSGFGNTACKTPDVDFGCYPGEDMMWIRPPCGSIFRCNADHHDVGPDPSRQRGALIRCGSRYFRPAPGQTRLNCTCALSEKTSTKHWSERASRTCGSRAVIDDSGGVSSAFRRLPMAAGGNPAVKCCRNKATSKGPINALNYTARNYAAWPAACEAMCDADPSCKYFSHFSHSFRFSSCITCRTCEPEIMLGDDTYASFQRTTEDATTLYQGVLA